MGAVDEKESKQSEFCSVTAGMPTYQRTDILLKTIKKILQCRPAPNEIIVHIDAGDQRTEDKVRLHFPEVKIIRSDTKVGPGGGRNKIISAATNSIVASFDDDSYPVDEDYFARLVYLFEQYPRAAVIAARIYHPGDSLEHQNDMKWVVDYTGCGCAHKREIFMKTSGYIPVTVPYGMEENDLALRLHCAGWKILGAGVLRVFHDTQLTHHTKPTIVAGSIANVALHVYLRYPLSYWAYGLLQYANKIFWMVRHRRLKGVLSGIVLTISLLRQFHHRREPVTSTALAEFLDLRRSPSPVAPKIGDLS